MIGRRVPHIANADKLLTVLEEYPGPDCFSGPLALLTDETGGYYSAELVSLERVTFAAAVNGHADEATARRDARRRARVAEPD